MKEVSNFHGLPDSQKHPTLPNSQFFPQYEQPGDFGGSSTSCFLCHQKAVGGGGVPQREEEAPLNATSPAAATLSRTISSCSTTNSASQGMMGLENWVAFRLCLFNSSSLPKYKSHRAANIHPKSNFTLNESFSKLAKNV
jgi:hypothetical protein